jgi:hypothetical protein
MGPDMNINNVRPETWKLMGESQQKTHGLQMRDIFLVGLGLRVAAPFAAVAAATFAIEQSPKIAYAAVSGIAKELGKVGKVAMVNAGNAYRQFEARVYRAKRQLMRLGVWKRMIGKDIHEFGQIVDNLPGFVKRNMARLRRNWIQLGTIDQFRRAVAATLRTREHDEPPEMGEIIDKIKDYEPLMDAIPKRERVVPTQEDAVYDVLASPKAADQIANVVTATQHAATETLQAEQAKGLHPNDKWRIHPEASISGRVCPLCLPMNGQPRSQWSLIYPSGPPSPHLIHNWTSPCYCTIDYVNAI